MKSVKRMLCIMAFSVSIFGCGEDRPPAFVTTHGSDTDPHDPEGYSEWWKIYFINRKNTNIIGGRVFFSRTGAFTHDLVRVYRTVGTYTTRGNTLTITKADTVRYLDALLDPDTAETPPLFKAGTEYTWEIDGKWLTLSRPQQQIVLLRQGLLDELETSSSWW